MYSVARIRSSRSRPAAIALTLFACGFLPAGCSEEEGIDPRIYGSWRSTERVEKFNRQAIIRFYIARDGLNAKLTKSTEYPDDDQPLTSAILGDHTFSLKHLEPGVLEKNNIDKSTLSKAACALIDCETVVRYRFENANTLV